MAEFIKGLRIQMDPKGGGGTKKHETTTVLVTTLRNRTTGRPAGRLRTTVRGSQNDSMDDIPPINPVTGKEENILQPPLPNPTSK